MIQTTLTSGYCIDTNALIDLWRRSYPPDVFEKLWRDIENFISQGFLISPQEVFDEIQQQDDELLKWAKKQKKMFQNLNKEQIKQVRIILDEFPELVDTQKQTADADPFLIALAKSKGWTVITSEKPSNGKKPKIPDVCKKYNIRCISLLDFFREQKLKY